jgi:hypothetical protein
MEIKPVILYKTLVVGVIFLFVGIGIQPAFADGSNFSDSDIGCNLCAEKVSKSHLGFINGLLNIIVKNENQLSTFSKQYPQIDEQYQELSNAITIFSEEVNNIYRNGDSFICAIIRVLCSPLARILNLLAPLPWYPSKYIIATLHSILSELYINFNCAG